MARMIRLGSMMAAVWLGMLPPCFLMGAEKTEHEANAAEEVEEESKAYASQSSSFRLLSELERPRSIFWAPFASYFLPGLDQWWERQWSYAALYSGTAYFGVQYTAAHSKILQREIELGRLNKSELNDATTRNQHVRSMRLGLQLYSFAGGLSAYHSFRTAIKSGGRRQEFAFLEKEESLQEILLAPFQGQYLLRASTLVPLGIAALYGALIFGSSKKDLEDAGLERTAFTSRDAFFAGATSYNAGVWEEAAFRGWFMPVMRQSLASDFWANMTTAGIFALAHLGSVEVPWAQALLGFYLGRVTQQNQWTIGEAIFIHSWWDVIVLSTSYHFRKKAKPELGQRAAPPLITLPPVSFSF